MDRSFIIYFLVVIHVIVVAIAAETKNKDPGHIIVYGRILCLEGNKPISGATVTLFCTGQAIGNKPQIVVTLISKPTNATGMYVIKVQATLPTGEKLIHCSATLKSSPLNTCNVATNINGGVKGFGLTKVQRTTEPRDKLFLVPDFFYSSK
ncbi:Proline-rich protein 3 [Bienertia sinuspersici]